MIEAEVTIVNQLGLHMRAAGKFAKLAGTFRSRVNILRDGITVDGKSIVGILTLAASIGTTFVVRTEGEDEREALTALQELIASKFGEDQ
ncbi:MAG TPA: HPr family phosphocarrier protein [Candidatus Polarisedimenticolia bacterium]|nr:HPr family phosphocarrier protein [Candidatus Polarisedimenticolia bacterium]